MLNQSQKQMSVTIGETKVVFECLSQLAHKQLGTATPIFLIEIWDSLPRSPRLCVYMVPPSRFSVPHP